MERMARMGLEAIELRLRAQRAQATEADLRLKLEETRELLQKADARRDRDKDQPQRWNKIIDQLETTYRTLKREVEIAAMNVQESSIKLARLLAASGVHLSAIDAEIAESKATEHEEVVEVVIAPEEFTSNEHKLGWRDLLHMPMEDLATLTEAEIATVENSLAQGGLEGMTNEERRLVEGRLHLAIELRATDTPAQAADLEAGEQPRQIVLRAAIEKIQRGRAQEMSDEEIRAVIWCQQRIAANANATPAEQRLLRIIEAALNIIRRHRLQVRA